MLRWVPRPAMEASCLLSSGINSQECHIIYYGHPEADRTFICRPWGASHSGCLGIECQRCSAMQWPLQVFNAALCNSDSLAFSQVQICRIHIHLHAFTVLFINVCSNLQWFANLISCYLIATWDAVSQHQPWVKLCRSKVTSISLCMQLMAFSTTQVVVIYPMEIWEETGFQWRVHVVQTTCISTGIQPLVSTSWIGPRSIMRLGSECHTIVKTMLQWSGGSLVVLTHVVLMVAVGSACPVVPEWEREREGERARGCCCHPWCLQSIIIVLHGELDASKLQEQEMYQESIRLSSGRCTVNNCKTFVNISRDSDTSWY